MEQISYTTETTDLDAIFAALSDPTRRSILKRLSRGEASLAEIAAPFRMSQPAVSKHLRVLESAGLVVRGIDKQRRPARLRAEPLAAAVRWLEEYRQFWTDSFTRLDDLLAEIKNTELKEKSDE